MTARSQLLSIILLAAACLAASPATKPAGLTLRFKDAPAAQVLAEIRRQSGIDVRLPEGNAPTISIETQAAPFWAVMRELCTRLKAMPYSPGAADVITLEDDETWSRHPISLSSDALLYAGHLHRIDTVHASGADRSSTFNFSFSAYLDPRTRLLNYEPSPSITEAKDDRGNSLLPNPKQEPATEEEQSEEQPSSPWELSLSALLKYPANPGRRIVLIKGTATAWSAAQTQRWEVDLPQATGAAHLAAGRRFVIDRVVKEEEQWRVDFTIHRGATGEDDWRVWKTLHHHRLIGLADARGRKLYVSDGDTRRSTDQFVTASLSLWTADPNGPGRDVGQPAKVFWDVPAKIEKLEVPFEFQNLPMP